MSNIRRLRKSLNITQAEFAKLLNVSRTTVTMWETDNREPDYDTIRNISSIFSISADYIIGSGVFLNWDMILERKEDVYEALRGVIPSDYAASDDEKYLLARLQIDMFFDFNEISLARWFSYAIKQVDFNTVDLPCIIFTPEFEAVIKAYSTDDKKNSPEVFTMKDMYNDFVDRHRIAGKRIPVYGDVAAGLPIEAMENIVDYEEIDEALAVTGDFFGLRVRGSSMEPRIREGDVVIVRKQSDAETGDTAIVMVNGDSATVKRIKKESSGISLIPNNPAYDIKFYSAEEIDSLPVRIIGKVVELRGKF